MLDYNFIINTIISDIFIMFMFNIPFYWFDPIDLVFWNNIINWFIYLFIFFIINLFLIFLWRYIYKNFNFKRKNFWNIYFLAFVLIIFPVLSIIWSFLLWMNNKKLFKIIRLYSIWFILYVVIWYLFYKYFHLSWGDLYLYIKNNNIF